MSEKQTDDDYAISPASMGPLELAVYRRDFKASLAYQRHVAAVTARRELEAAAKAAQEQVMKAAGARGGPTAAKTSRGSLDRLRNSPRFSVDDDDDVESREAGYWYLSIPDARALRELLSLWDRFTRREAISGYQEQIVSLLWTRPVQLSLHIAKLSL